MIILWLIAGVVLLVIAGVVLILWLADHTKVFWHGPTNGAERVSLLQDALRTAIQALGGEEAAKTAAPEAMVEAMQDYLEVRHIALTVTPRDARVMYADHLKPATLGEALRGQLK